MLGHEHERPEGEIVSSGRAASIASASHRHVRSAEKEAIATIASERQLVGMPWLVARSAMGRTRTACATASAGAPRWTTNRADKRWHIVELATSAASRLWSSTMPPWRPLPHGRRSHLGEPFGGTSQRTGTRLHLDSPHGTHLSAQRQKHARLSLERHRRFHAPPVFACLWRDATSTQGTTASPACRPRALPVAFRHRHARSGPRRDPIPLPARHAFACLWRDATARHQGLHCAGCTVHRAEHDIK